MDGRKYKLRYFFFLFLLFSVLLLSCDTQVEQEKVYTGPALGTSYQVKYFSDKDINTQKALDSIIEVINSSMSTYQKDSDISRINRGDTSVTVDGNFKDVFRYAKQVHEESEGYFDPTVGNLVNAYGFGPTKKLNNLDSVTIDSLVQYVGLEKVKLERDRIIKETPEIYLDFNAIAKGYMVDVIAEYLDGKGVENYLIEVGGELIGKGRNIAKNNPWMVAISDPKQILGTSSFFATLVLEDRAMATSGNYIKFIVDPVTGIRFVHTINPLTGQAEKSNLLSVSVLAENCALADAYATAFMALGYEKSREIMNKIKGIDVYFIYSEEDQEIGVFTTEGFNKVLQD